MAYIRKHKIDLKDHHLPSMYNGILSRADKPVLYLNGSSVVTGTCLEQKGTAIAKGIYVQHATDAHGINITLINEKNAVICVKKIRHVEGEPSPKSIHFGERQLCIQWNKSLDFLALQEFPSLPSSATLLHYRFSDENKDFKSACMYGNIVYAMSSDFAIVKCRIIQCQIVQEEVIKRIPPAYENCSIPPEIFYIPIAIWAIDDLSLIMLTRTVTDTGLLWEVVVGTVEENENQDTASYFKVLLADLFREHRYNMVLLKIIPVQSLQRIIVLFNTAVFVCNREGEIVFKATAEKEIFQDIILDRFTGSFAIVNTRALFSYFQCLDSIAINLDDDIIDSLKNPAFFTNETLVIQGVSYRNMFSTSHLLLIKAMLNRYDTSLSSCYLVTQGFCIIAIGVVTPFRNCGIMEVQRGLILLNPSFMGHAIHMIGKKYGLFVLNEVCPEMRNTMISFGAEIIEYQENKQVGWAFPPPPSQRIYLPAQKSFYCSASSNQFMKIPAGWKPLLNFDYTTVETSNRYTVTNFLQHMRQVLSYATSEKTSLKAISYLLNQLCGTNVLIPHVERVSTTKLVSTPPFQEVAAAFNAVRSVMLTQHCSGTNLYTQLMSELHENQKITINEREHINPLHLWLIECCLWCQFIIVTHNGKEYKQITVDEAIPQLSNLRKYVKTKPPSGACQSDKRPVVFLYGVHQPLHYLVLTLSIPAPGKSFTNARGAFNRKCNITGITKDDVHFLAKHERRNSVNDIVIL